MLSTQYDTDVRTIKESSILTQEPASEPHPGKGKAVPVLN